MKVSDDSQIIGYKPNLVYDKDFKVIPTIEEVKKYTDPTTILAQNSPSTILSALGNTNALIGSMQDKLKELFLANEYDKYNDLSQLINAYMSGDKDIVKDFVKWHKDNIQGSAVPEILDLIKTTESILKDLAKTVKKLYYGDENISDADAAKKDDTMLKRIKELEDESHAYKINYLAIVYDTEVTKLVKSYTYNINRLLVDLTQAAYSNEVDGISPARASTVMRVFDELNEEVNARINSSDVSTQEDAVAYIQKSLYYYYNKKKECLEICSLAFETGESSNYILNYKQKTIDSVRDGLIALTQSTKSYEVYLSEMNNLLVEKQNIRDLYANLNIG